MKVILTQELKGRGHEGDVIDVARGYAANYLIPRKMAMEATPGTLKQLESRKGNIDRRNLERRTDAEAVAESLNGKSIVIEAKAGDEGKLFGSVTGLMIEEAVAAQLGRDIDHRRMDLNRPIKSLGEYPITLSVFGDVKAEIIVNVVPEGGEVAHVAPAAPEEPVAEGPVEEVAETEETAEASETAEEPVAAEDETADEGDEADEN